MKLTKDQIQFQRDMHWTGTKSGAFQHVNLYKSSNNTRKEEFHVQLRQQLEKMESVYQNRKLTSKGHATQIQNLQEWSKNFKDILSGGKLIFGVCQKLLNLHLKGLWCLGILKNEPPHLPVDRVIQQKLKLKKITSWTQIKTANEYLAVISEFETIAKQRETTLARLELEEYNKATRKAK